jgi:ComF family protein
MEIERCMRVELRYLWRRAWEGLWSSLALPYCAACGEPGRGPAGDPLCEDCRAELGRLPEGGLLLGEAWGPGLGPGEGGGRAPGQRKGARGALTRVHAVFAYRATGGRLVRRAKFEGDRAALGFLGRAMARVARERLVATERLLVPVPLARGRRRERGFNQAEELARFVAQALGMPVLPRALRRIRETRPQGQVTTKERQRNVRGAFAPARFGQSVRGRRVLLIDDVSTSGSTLQECARVLLAAGAREVEALIAAASPR